MARPEISTKRLAISKASAQMVAIVASAAFVSVFCLMAAQTVWKQNQYRSRVIDAKELARDTLESNVEAVSKLVSSYKSFDRKDPNIISGQRGGSGDNDGSNAKIVLDALPSAYDFPAVTSSLEKVLDGINLNVTNIGGVDEQLDKESAQSSPTPQAVAMPFSFSVSDANYAQIQALILALDRSIRPIQINSIILGGAVNDMDLTVEAQTYYQPAKSLKIEKKVVK